MVAQHPVEARQVRGLRMRALDHLRQLARVAGQHDVAGSPAHGDHVGQTHLPRLIHEEPVESLHVLVAGEELGRRANNVPDSSRLVIAGGAVDRAIVGVAVILAAGLVDQIQHQVGVVQLQRAQAVHPISESLDALIANHVGIAPVQFGRRQ